MSLVVAQVTEDGPCIVSDTRVGFLDGRRPSYKTGTLKTIVLTPELSASFAGDVDAGLSGVRYFARGLMAGLAADELLPHLLELSADSHRPVDFILASAAIDSTLTRVRAGKLEPELSSAWVGDKDAFERFQEERLRPVEGFRLEMLNGLPTSTRALLTLGDAMKAVIADPAITSVDDFCVRVSAGGGVFNYRAMTFIHVGRDITIRDGDDLISKMAQPVEEGGYAVSVVEPEEPGTPALALNFPRARMGMVYLPLEYDEAQVIRDVSPNDFARVVLERYGVKMAEPMLRH